MKHSRRSIMRMAAACAAAAVITIPANAAKPARKLGRITAGRNDRVGPNGESAIRCFVDGVDVTNVCFEADDVEGWAKCYHWEDYPAPPGDRPVFTEDVTWSTTRNAPRQSFKVMLRGNVEFQWH